jgi:hypothetical protein
LLKAKFGESGFALMPEIRAITDSKRLDAILDSIDAGASLDDLQRLLAQ